MMYTCKGQSTGQQHVIDSWYPQGHSLDYLPFSFPDPSRQWAYTV